MDIKKAQTLFDILDKHQLNAVLFDLDDTLYSEHDYVMSCFDEVALYIEKQFGIASAFAKLNSLFEQDKGYVFNRLLEQEGRLYTEETIKELLNIYKNHKPNISLSNETVCLLNELKNRGYRIGIITDGNPVQQQNKLDALGIEKFAERIIITDSLGGIEFRKPNPRAFELMKEHFGADYEQMVYIGDNPKKDFAIKAVYPILTVQILRGYYSDKDYKNGIKPDYLLTSLF